MNDNELRNALRPGHKLLWFEIQDVLGQGGFGITYRALDTNLAQEVAIKEYLPMELAVREGDFSVYPASQAQDERYQWGLDRFLVEARTLAKFKHPAIVGVMSVFEENNTAYMVMEYQRGKNLQEIVEQRPTLPEKSLSSMVKRLLGGLEVLHAEGFIHRDIKPANLFIREDARPILLDFGSARQALGVETQTLTSVVSPGYAPFEQYYSRSDRQGPWTDIYGLGATLYRCVSGRAPMPAIDRSEAILKAQRDVFVSAKEIGAGKYSESFLNAIDVALAFNESERPQSVNEWRTYFGYGPASNPPRAPVTEPIIHDGPTEVAPSQIPTTPVTKQTQPQERTVEQTVVINDQATASGTNTSPATASAPAAATEPISVTAPPQRRGVWPLIALLLTGLGGAGWYAWDRGLMPEISVTTPQTREAEQLIARADRALAAGQVFAGGAENALALYASALALEPENLDASHGIGIAGARLLAALRVALADTDRDQVSELKAALTALPSDFPDLDAVKQEMGLAELRWQEEQALAEAIEKQLAAAEVALENGVLTGDGDDDALAKFRDVLRLDPNNAAAQAGVDRVAANFLQRAKDALDAKDFQLATTELARAQTISPANEAILALATALSDAKGNEAARREKDATIAELLSKANRDLANGRLSEPAGNNALERYRAVRLLEPKNAPAKQGIRRVHDRFIERARAALNATAIADARALLAKAQNALPKSSSASELEMEILAQETRLARENAERNREQAEQARIAAEREAEKRRLEDEERQLAEELARQEAEQQAIEDERRRQEELDNRISRVVFDFDGFHPKYARQSVTVERLIDKIQPIFKRGGYTIVSRTDVHDENYRWTNLSLVIFKLSVNENSANGLYSYASSLNVYGHDLITLPTREVLEIRPDWTKGYNGLGPESDLRFVMEHFVKMSESFVKRRPGRRR
ncbi:MAG: protein kinase [Pseudomonadota bacterium]